MSNFQLTEEMARAINIIEDTTQHLFITGKAGTGKTTLLRHIVNNTCKEVVVAASTGVAAINARGVTLHSLFKIPFGAIDPNAKITDTLHPKKIELLNNIDTLVIDEISMVRPDTIDFIDKRLRRVRGSKLPFGGVQVVMLGDLYQLPPVIKPAEKEILYHFYDGFYFFNAHVFSQCGFNVVELSQIFRQTDKRFVEILNNIRAYKMTEDDIDDLASLRDKAGSAVFDDKRIHICTHRKDVDAINRKMLGFSTDEFDAQLSGNFKEGMAPCDIKLRLREGARVMTLINDTKQGFYNGSLGIVSEITADKIMVILDTGKRVEITPYEWKNEDYELAGGVVVKTVKGTCKQFPLTLAWAITIHKSQGLTFNEVTIHSKGVFTPGQIYVALSRCTSMEGVICDSFIGRKHLLKDNDILLFEEKYKPNNYYKR